MSGYASRRDVVDVVRRTIEQDTARTGLPRRPDLFNISAIVRENFAYRGRGFGWRASTDAAAFAASLHRNVRRPPAPVVEPIVDPDSGTTYTLHVRDGGHQVGVRAERDGRFAYVYLVPSTGSDDGVATVFLYAGPTGECDRDAALSHVAPWHDDREG